MNNTLSLALLGDKVGAEVIQMKAVNDISLHLDIKRDSEQEEKGYLK